MLSITRTNLASVLKGLKIPKNKRDAQVFDSKLAGFGVRKFASGKSSFFVKYVAAGQQRKLTLGPAVASRVEDARAEAAAIIAKACLGEDAQANKRARRAKSTLTLHTLAEQYLKARQGEWSDHYVVDNRRYLLEIFNPLHRHAVDSIRRPEVVVLLDRVAAERGAHTADRAKAALSGLYGWLIERGYVDVSPLLHIKPRANGGGRERVLVEDELANIWEMTEVTGDHGAIVRLLMLTGQRKSEIGDLMWSEVNLDKKQIELGGSRTKNRKPHVIPLSRQALKILKGLHRHAGRDHVFGKGSRGFQGWSKSKAALDAELPEMEPWRLHDIRRSVVTLMSEAGIAQPHVIEAIVNHVSGSKAGVAGIYNKAAYAAEKRHALQAWGEHLARVVE